MPNPVEISIVTVAYNSAEVLPGLLESIPPGIEVVLVDNGPDDGMRDLAQSRGATVIVPEANLGFGRGCNLGAARARGTYLFFLNPDARLRPDTLDQLTAAIDRHPDAAGFGPLQEDETGRCFFKRRSRIRRDIPALPGMAPRVDTRVTVLSGAALLVPRRAFEKVQGFDPEIFLFYEDDDISLRLSAQAGPLWLIPTTRVIHIGGASSPASPRAARFKGYHWGRSRVYVSRKHQAPRPLLRGLSNALNFLLSPRSLYSATHRSEGLGRLAGAWSQRRSDNSPDSTINGP